MVGRQVKTAEILYHVAEDFVTLSFIQKFNIGLEMKFLKPEEVQLTESQIEERIFKAMYRDHKFSEFVKLVYRVRHE